jgi:hypothetical protein
LKAPITTNFKKPKVRDVLDSLEKATGLKFRKKGLRLANRVPPR